jgi:hypothetical protein
MARLIAARKRLCAGAGWPGVYSPALVATPVRRSYWRNLSFGKRG